MLLLQNPVKFNSPTILVPYESWIYLQEKSYNERIGKSFTEKIIERRKHSFEQHSRDGKKQLMNGDLGGCRGPVENAWEERRWTSWSVKDMAYMLDEAGLPWEAGGEVECIAL